jgi:hypothetical protein
MHRHKFHVDVFPLLNRANIRGCPLHLAVHRKEMLHAVMLRTLTFVNEMPIDSLPEIVQIPLRFLHRLDGLLRSSLPDGIVKICHETAIRVPQVIERL